ncbi:TonB-dependent siderophore receptor [Aromatoleum toluclasticum]|uniref:TonB-dependent siderophore receptor n=1 Tax=Aromatoleum toluclasticum TaxID=92003 RepID=UPI001D18F369|nr:TonB-dependent siderophore receptor [Aromatoleum toluclasticum]MCC4115478.1 TonB-dependent siderophore receptor [Aromatoleum toluclasticum]
MRLKTLARLIPAALLVTYGSAHAQEKQLEAVEVFATESSWRAGSVGVGTFRDTPAKDVPMTINVVDRDLLDAQQANSLYEAMKNTAGVARAQLGATAYDNLSIRGLLVENRSNYRLNGGLPVVNLIDLPLENKERVEVLKGVGGLYYGFVPPSGIINLVTKRAGSTPVTAVQFSTDDNGSSVAGLDVGRRFGADGQFAARVNIVGGQLESPVRDAGGDRHLYAGAFDWQVTDRWLLKLDVEDITKDVVEQSSIKTLNAVNGKIPLPRIPDPRKLIAPDWANYDAKAQNVQLRSDFAIDDNWIWTVEAGRAYLERDRNFSQMENYNLATGEGRLRISRTKDQDYTNRNLRTELAGRITTGAVTHDLTFGYAQNTLNQTLGTTRQVTVAQNLFNPRDIAKTAVTYPAMQPHFDTRDKGWYVFDRAGFGDWLLMGGLRASEFGYDHPTTEYTKHKVTPTLAAVYKLTPATNLYAGYLEGLEDGGSAPLGTVNEFEPQKPMVTKQWEGGIKTEWQGLQANAALFQIERPMNGVNPNGTTSTADDRYERLGEGRYRGVEVSAGGRIAPRWSLFASAQWLDAEFTEAENDPRLVGNRPANTPRVTASLFVEHSLAAVPGLALSAGAYYTGEREVDPLNQAAVDGFTRYDLGARYRTKLDGKQLDLVANVENVTDERYWAAAGDSRVNSNSPLLAVGMPRTLRLSAKLSF